MRLVRGLLAGAAGTAAMTAYQEALSDGGGSKEPSWDDASRPLGRLVRPARPARALRAALGVPRADGRQGLSYHLVYGVGVVAAFEAVA